MAGKEELGFVTEPEKRIPCVYNADVAVAGGGVSGIIAALASARNGAETVLIERFGSPGGNIGPGLFVGGSLTGYPSINYRQALAAIPREFIVNHAAHGGGAIPPFSKGHYLRDSSVATCVAMKMLEEAGVKLMLSSYASDPILEGNTIRGIFVENKSGRQAVKARVVIDDTGEADVARRAGAPILYPDPDVKEKGRAMGLYYVVGGVDWNRYTIASGDYNREKDLSGDDLMMGDRLYKSAIQRAEEAGEYKSTKDVDDLCTLISFGFQMNEYARDGFASGYVAINKPHYINPGDGEVISKLEAQMRLYAFETFEFWKKRLPGFDESYLLTIAPFLGSRGGPAIEGEYVMKEEDFEKGKRFDDVIYLFTRENNPRWTDIPYRALLPKKIDGLLAIGRCASAKPASLLRSRISLMNMGQAGGAAAAFAARQGVSPRQLDVKELQWYLIESGFHLGDKARLSELGLLNS